MKHSYFSRLATEKNREKIAGYAFILPDTVGIFIFMIVPIVLAFIVSLTKWTGLSEPQTVGFRNYLTLFNDWIWWHSIKITLLFVIIFVPIMIFGSLGLALLVNSHVKLLKDIFRISFFAPYMLSMIVTSIIWKFFYAPLNGLINQTLRALHLPTFQWLGSKDIALLCILFVYLWWYIGYYMILFIAGLNDIPKMYYDAAAVDGAGKWAQFVQITLPLLKPTMLFVMVVLTIESFQVFDIVYVMTRGGPGRATYVNVFYIYERAFITLKFGYASAMAFILFIIISLTSIFQFKYFHSGGDY